MWYDLDLQLKHCNAGRYYEYNLLNRPRDNAGFDLFCVDTAAVTNSEVTLLHLGVAACMYAVDSDTEERTPVHFWLLPRSSIYKTGVLMANSTGVIDSTYRGELQAPVVTWHAAANIDAGTRLFQVVAPDMGWIRNVRIVDEMPSSIRGAGGFGSTGR